MAIPDFGKGFDALLADLFSEILPKQIVVVNPADYERIKTEMEERPDIYSRVELQSSVQVEPGQAITFPKPRDDV